jgi:transcriptional regulator with GAF, ATPase, and Fis domain
VFCREHEFERVGGTGSIQIDVRVIAATNRGLPAAIAAGTFRSDLFYQLNVFPMEMPSLRERREDIPCWSSTSLIVMQGKRERVFKR